MDKAADAGAAERSVRPIAMLMAGTKAGLVGHEHLVERLLIALLSGGHVLIEGPPGLAKTRAVKRLADGLAGSFARIQCTPDLMPADITGTQVFRKDSERLDFVPGPVFHSLVLVDEINRAPPKVQSALLEAMAEGQITVGGATHALPKPFMVVATQNSIEHEGTFPLPEAQLDRFQIHVDLDFPDAEAELSILNMVERELTTAQEDPGAPLSAQEVLAAQAQAAQVHLAPALKDYIVRIVMATRGSDEFPEVREAIEHPVSPRGTLALAAAVRARAYLMGRDYGLPEDATLLARDTLSHRLIPTWRALAEGDTARAIVGRILERVRPY